MFGFSVSKFGLWTLLLFQLLCVLVHLTNGRPSFDDEDPVDEDEEVDQDEVQDEDWEYDEDGTDQKKTGERSAGDVGCYFAGNDLRPKCETILGCCRTTECKKLGYTEQYCQALANFDKLQGMKEREIAKPTGT